MPVHVGFVIDQVTMGEVFLQVIWFSPVTIIPPWLSILIYHQGDEQTAWWWLQFRDIVSLHLHEQEKYFIHTIFIQLCSSAYLTQFFISDKLI
jgi:hypothetical protein